MTKRLEYIPLQTGYSSEELGGHIYIPLDGGPGRKRQDILLPGNVVTCQWLLRGQVEYTRFMGFFVTTLRYGRDDFLLDLITDLGIPTTHKCRTLGGLPQLVQQQNEGFWVRCTLEVDKNPTFTGNLNFLEEGAINFNTGGSAMSQFIQAGDTIRVLFSSGFHPTGPTPLNLDGEYTVESVAGFSITLEDPASVNSDWDILAGIGTSEEYGGPTKGNVNSTVTKVPT